MIKRFRKVVDGLYRGGALSPEDVVNLKEQLGIKKIISLDEKVGERISRICRALGIKQVKAYIEDRKSLYPILQHNLKKWLLDDGPTFVGCVEGKDRTGLVIALFKCQYLGVPPEKALQEAKSLGFGIGVDPKMKDLYEKIILSCKSKDNNDADVVSNQREYIGDNRDSYLDVSNQSSFAPYLDHTKQNPMDAVYLPINDNGQTPNRQTYKMPIKPHKIEEQKDIIPQVGIYNNDAGIYGVGPVINSGGFIYD